MTELEKEIQKLQKRIAELESKLEKVETIDNNTHTLFIGKVKTKKKI